MVWLIVACHDRCHGELQMEARVQEGVEDAMCQYTEEEEEEEETIASG